MGTAPLGKPAASSELLLNVELGPTTTPTTWLADRGLAATTFVCAFTSATVPSDNEVAPAFDENRNTAPAVAINTMPTNCAHIAAPAFGTEERVPFAGDLLTRLLSVVLAMLILSSAL